VVTCEKTPPRSALWRPCILRENTHRDIHWLLFYAAGVGAFTAQQPDDFHSRATRALAPLLYQVSLVGFLALYILIQEQGILYGPLIAFASKTQSIGF
jgi:hypothetical protein